jgi:predicted acylesterase/phospholipase RssA
MENDKAIITEDKSTTTEDLIKLETDENIFLEFDTLVLAGGSSKCLMTLGALQYAYDNNIIRNIDTYIGTSAGAIICFLLIIGYTPVDIIVYLCIHQLIEKLQNFNIVGMLNGCGATSFSPIYEQLEKMTIDKIGYLPTFDDIYTKYNKNLICVTYNLTDNSTEYLSYESDPHLPCLIALKMSANLPLIFENFKYGNKFYIDGGISNNFAINIAEEKGKKILGLHIDSDSESFNTGTEMNMLEFIYKLIFIPIDQGIIYKIKHVTKSKIINLSSNIKFFNFNINSKEKLDIFSLGYEQMKTQIEDCI